MTKGKSSARKRRRWLVISAIAVGSVIATLLLGNIRFFQWMHMKAGDFHFLIRGKQPTSDIVVLAIDQKSLNTFHELLMFWHPYYAEAIKAAADGGAKVLGFDWVFAVDVSKWEPDHDRLLSEAVIQTMDRMPVVCAYVSDMNGKQKEWPVQINILSAAFNNNAFANLTADADDFIRNQVLIENPDEKGNYSRSLALRVAERFRGLDSEFKNGKLVWNGRTIPTNQLNNIAINYAGPPETFPFIPLSDFIAAARAGNKEQIRTWVQGKIVLLGPNSGVEDRHPTPFYTAFSGLKYNTAGVEIHANTLRTLLTGGYLVPVSEPVRISALALVSLVTSVAAASLAVAQTGYWIALAVAATAAVTHILFLYGILLSTSELLLTCLVSILASSIYRFLTAEKFSAFTQNVISVFVGRSFADSISEEQQISRKGRAMTLTIMFSDIRGFTAFCEEKDPAVVVELLNEYLGAMVEIIVKHHGNVNKFIGDGILVIFSDEDEGVVPGDHALRAVRCGTEMVQLELPSKFKTGVGIHSGPGVVGNIGSPDKMEYTVLGDTVNLASRLESLNKEMKTQLILSDATKQLLNGQFETAYLAEVPVRGKTLPLIIHTSAVLRTPKPDAGALAQKI